MENFSIESANKKILVNNVELHLNFDDDMFLKNCDILGNKLREFAEKAGSIDASTEEMSAEIDRLFGENTCMKLFNCKTPNALILLQFLNYIKKFIDEFRNDYVSKIQEKYDPDRIGNSNV